MSLGPRTRVRQMPPLPRPSQIRNIILLVVLLVLAIWAISTTADLIISYNWWKEVGQVGTWVSMLWYSIAPAGAGAVIAFVALFVAHARGPGVCRHPPAGFPAVLPAGSGRAWDRGGAFRFGSRLTTGRSCASSARVAWRRPRTPGRIRFSRARCRFIFSICLSIRRYSDLCLCWRFCARWSSGSTARGWQLWLRGGIEHTVEVGPRAFLLPGASRTNFVRVLAVIFLLGLAVWVYLGNYDLLLNSHAFMTGADYVDAKITLPLRWLLIGCDSRGAAAGVDGALQEGRHPGGGLFRSGS